jgi:hypothetical protein
VEEHNKLQYTFEDNIIMVIRKDDDNFQMNLAILNNDKFVSKQIDPFIVKYFKKINLTSVEFDKIHDLFNDNK